MKKNFPRWAVILGCVAATGALHAQTPPEPARTSDGILVDAKGMALYTFDKDTPLKSACNDGCAVNWPPLLADEKAKAGGDWSIVRRDDGQQQWAYKGRPLYTWIKDTQCATPQLQSLVHRNLEKNE